ncbi:MAG: FtsQ-type POTRA domain-containing protein [Verrucomicrobiota bacterium]
MAVTKTSPRTKSKTSSPRKCGNSWKNIDQEVKKKDMSDASRRHFRSKALRKLAFAVCGLAVAAVVVKYALFDDRAPELLSKAGRSLPVKSIEVQGDGALGFQWAMEYLELEDKELDLLTVDIQGLKGHLEKVPQIKRADVHREYPDGLFISIHERSPIARINAVDKQGDRIALYVDGEGTIFPGMDYDKQMTRSLPHLAGIRLKREGEGFAPIEGIESLDKLLSEARTIAPHIYKTWNVVSLEKLPQIVVKSRRAKEIVFEPRNYRRQLAKLDYIMDHQRGSLNSQMARVDLTLGAQVPVRLSAFGN